MNSIWKKHLENHEQLDEYAYSMSHLAEDHWKEKSYGETIKDYFLSTPINGLHQKLSRDKRKGVSTDICPSCEPRILFVSCFFFRLI